MSENCSNIEIINFESMGAEEEVTIENNDIGMEYLTNFLLERFGPECDSQFESMMSDCENALGGMTEMKGFVSANLGGMSTNDTGGVFLEPGKCKPSQFVEKPVKMESPPSETSTTPENEKPFPCTFENCKKSFKYKWILDRHFLSHKSIKNFKCNYKGCTKSYKSKENLTLHFKNIHLKEKPYSCRYCPSVFSHRNGKTYHERKFHTNYLPHVCQVEGCECCFASKSALTYHTKSHHLNKNSKRFNNASKMSRSKFNTEILKTLNEFEDSSGHMTTYFMPIN